MIRLSDSGFAEASQQKLKGRVGRLSKHRMKHLILASW